MPKLRRVFWNLYGRFVWDTHKAPRRTRVRAIVEILQARRVMPGERVLDAGCGTGDFAVALARAGFRVTGIDYAAGMLARAQAKVTQELSDSLSFQQADLNTRLAFSDAHFDHAINISVLQATANPVFTLGELWRVLKPEGTLVLLHVPQPESHTLSWRQDINNRIHDIGARTPWEKALIAAKTWAERTGHSRHWTAVELDEMFETSRFNVLSTDHGPPIVIVAEKMIMTTLDPSHHV